MISDVFQIEKGRTSLPHEIATVRELTVSDFIATLNCLSDFKADDGDHTFTAPRQICRV